MSLSRKRQESHRTVKLQEDHQIAGGNQSILSICSAKQSGLMPQYSMNNTPSSQSASLRLQNQTQQSYEHISNSQTKQVKNHNHHHPTSNLTALVKKASLKTNQRKQQSSQKQTQALISTSNSASIVQTSNNNCTGGVNQNNSQQLHRATTPMSSQDTTTNGSNPTNFSCLIQKQMTSSNYGAGNGPNPSYTSKSGGISNHNQQQQPGGVTRSLEKLSYKVINSSTVNHHQQDHHHHVTSGSKTGSQSQHNSVSLSRVHAVVSGVPGNIATSSTIGMETSSSQHSSSHQQYNRGSQQPQQKQKIKAFKTRGGDHHHHANKLQQQQSADGKMQSNYGGSNNCKNPQQSSSHGATGQQQHQVVLSRNGGGSGMQRLMATTSSNSEVSSVRTGGGANTSNHPTTTQTTNSNQMVGGVNGATTATTQHQLLASNGSKRSNGGGGNFVSLGGVVSKTNAADAKQSQFHHHHLQQHQQQSTLPVNSSSSLKNTTTTSGQLFAPVVTASVPQQNQTTKAVGAHQASSTKSGGAMASSILSTSSGYPGQGTITQQSNNNHNTGANQGSNKIGVFRADRLSSQRGAGHQLNVVTTQQSSKKLMRPQSSKKTVKDSSVVPSGAETQNQQQQKLSSSSINSQLQTAPKSKRGGGAATDSSHHNAQVTSNHKKATSSNNAAGASGQGGPDAPTSSQIADTKSYCPKLLNLNSSQEIVMRNQPATTVNLNSNGAVKKSSSSKNNQYTIGHMITSPNQACLLPGHMIKANGPNSMQASSKPTTSNQQPSFLPPQASQNGQVLLSASFEKLNLWNPQSQQNGSNTNQNNASKSSNKQQSSQQQLASSSLRSHQQILRQHQTNMQAYLHGVNSAGVAAQHPTTSQNNLSSVNNSSSLTTAGLMGSHSNKTSNNLKVKKATATLAPAGTNKASQSKSFMTPQRINKNKAQGVPQQVTQNSFKEQANGGSKQQAANKAQQYLRNSFMAKQHQAQQQHQSQAATSSSISPRSTNLAGVVPNNSRNAVILQTSATTQSQPHQSQSLNTTSTAVTGVGGLPQKSSEMQRHSPLNGCLPQPSASSFHQMASKQKQQISGGAGGPGTKHLNILSTKAGVTGILLPGGSNSKAAAVLKAEKQAQLSAAAQQQKLMIDKKTYEDLMSYLVKAECKRLKHHDITTTSNNAAGNKDSSLNGCQNAALAKTPQNTSSVSANQQQHIKPSSSNSNLNSINSSKNKRSSPGGRPVGGISNSTATSGKKAKDNNLIPNSQQPPSQVAFQSQQPVARQGAWQNQTSHSNHLLRSENHSQENPKSTQHHVGLSSKQSSLHNAQQRILPSSKHGSLPMNAASKNKVAVTSFMVAPGNIHPIQTNIQKTQMLKTTISQTSQSRDASLTSHKTNGQIATTSQGGGPKGGNKISMKQVNAMSLFPSGNSGASKHQNLMTKQGAATRNGKPHQLFVKGGGTKQMANHQSRNGNNLLSGITNSRNSQNNQNNTVYTVSLKSTNNLPFPEMLHQPSPNQTVISSGQVRASGAGGDGRNGPSTKKAVANMVAATIPTKIIKARSLIRGTTTQAPVNAKVMVNVLKKHVSHNQGATPGVPQETLKNNFMGPLKANHSQKQSQENAVASSGQQPPKRPSGGIVNNPHTIGNRSSRSGVSELQLKQVVNFQHKDRVQSAKSSATTRALQAAQQNSKNGSGGINSKNNSNLRKVSLSRSNVGAVSNGGALSQRESQRYFSRPSGGENPQQQQQQRSTSQNQSSKERQRKRPSAESQSNRGSSKSIGRSTSRQSNTSQTAGLQDSGHKVAVGSKRRTKKQSSKRGGNAGQGGAAGEAGGAPPVTDLEQTILSGVHLIVDKTVLTDKQQKVMMKHSCDIEAEDAMEGMVGGNFNTFGEQAPKDYFEKKQQSIEEDIMILNNHAEAPGASETLIERIEKQIEAELRESKDAASSSALHPMFEVNEMSNSIGTHDSNTIDIVAKPPQNSLAPQADDDCLLQTIQSRQKDPAQTLDTHEAEKQSQEAVTSHKVDGLQNFHYSGSFGIPDSSLATSPYKDCPEVLERDTIAIEATQLYAAAIQPIVTGTGGISAAPSQCNTIDGTKPAPKQVLPSSSNKQLPGSSLLLATKSEEYQDKMELVDQQRHHQTLQDHGTSKGVGRIHNNHDQQHLQHKGHFQLINMSFSQENNNTSEYVDPAHHNQSSQAKKNPHNTLIEDSQILQQSSTEDNIYYNDITETAHKKQQLITADLLLKPDDTELLQQEVLVTEKIYSDSEYRKELLLRVLPKFEKFDQFDELHTDFVASVHAGSTQLEEQKIYEKSPSEMESKDHEAIQSQQPKPMIVSTGAVQLLRQINLSLGRGDSSSLVPPIVVQPPQQYLQKSATDSQIADESLDERMEVNTVVENECEGEFDYHISGAPSINKGVDCQSPSVTSMEDRQIKSFESPSIQSPQNSTRIELQTPSNVTSALQSHYASQNTNQDDLDCQEETRLILLQSSEPESHRKQGGAFAVCSPRTAALASAIYEDGANGGRQAVIAMSSVRNSKQINEQDMMLPQFGCIAVAQAASSNQGLMLDDGEEEEEEEEEDEEINQSFQTVLAGGDDSDSKCLMIQDGGTTNNSCQYYDENSVSQAVTSFYGPEKTQYEEMVSIIQHHNVGGCGTTDDDELMDEQTVRQIDAKNQVDSKPSGKMTVITKTLTKQQPQASQKVHKQLGNTSSSGTAQVLYVCSTAEGEDTGGGSQANSQSPQTIEQFRKSKKPIAASKRSQAKKQQMTSGAKTKQLNANSKATKGKQQQIVAAEEHQQQQFQENDENDDVDDEEEEEEEDEDDDQFLFVQNLNKQYADAMQQRKIMKMMNRPRQNSC